MKRFFVFHPFGFGIFPILFLYIVNPTRIPPGEIVLPLLIVIGFVVGGLLVLQPVIANRLRRGLVLSVFLILFFAYGHVIRRFSEIRFTAGGLEIGPDELVLLLWCILLILAVYLTLRTRRDLHGLTKVMNVVALVLVIWQVLAFGNSLLSSPGTPEPRPIKQASGSPTAKPPDIYYIILDGYARADVLREIYQYDNSDFLGFLRQRGFHVAEKSRTNYCQTLLSMASSLNLDYLQNMATFDPMSGSRGPALYMLHNNRLFGFLERFQYTLIAFASGYSYTEFGSADFYLEPSSALSEFHNVLLTTTPIPFFLRWGKTQYDYHRDRIEYILDNLAQVPEADGPRLVIAHLVTPHPPFVFGAKGEKVARRRLFNFSDGSHYFTEGGTPEEYLNGYRNQLAYINGRLQKTIAEILDRSSDNPPIIILQADHGPGFGLDWDSTPTSDLKERFCIFNAYYLPRLERDPIYEEITPVNTFRVILNQYFGAHLPLLPGRSYFSPIDRPFDFFEVPYPDSLSDSSARRP